MDEELSVFGKKKSDLVFWLSGCLVVWWSGGLVVKLFSYKVV
jgi:hypothetical protein